MPAGANGHAPGRHVGERRPPQFLQIGVEAINRLVIHKIKAAIGAERRCNAWVETRDGLTHVEPGGQVAAIELVDKDLVVAQDVEAAGFRY